jgi:hypothetical protein
VLRERGFAEWEGERVDQDLMAVRAGTVLPEEGPVHSVPLGAVSRRDYRFELPVAATPEVAGTAAADLGAAIEQVSGGALRAVPLRGAWTAEVVERLVEGLAGRARLIANVRTARLWGTRPPLESVLAHLAGTDVEGPAAEWDVGHFVELVSLVRGPGAGASLLVVCDSYPTLGWQAHHVQPPAAAAAALLRGDGREGGVLAVVAAAQAARVEELAAELGLDIGTWDNGTRR